MPTFDISQYETVKSRKKRFYADHPDGRIIAENKSTDILSYALFEAKIFRNRDDQTENLPCAIGNALEIRDVEHRISNRGNEYESVNYSSWVENCEESAVGRGLDNAGYSGNDKCSCEEMRKVVRKNNVIAGDGGGIAAEIEPPQAWVLDDAHKPGKSLFSEWQKIMTKQQIREKYGYYSPPDENGIFHWYSKVECDEWWNQVATHE